MKIAIVVLFCAASVTAILVANTSRPTPFASLRYEADGDPDTGKVSVEVHQDEKGKIVSGKVSAFGRAFTLPAEKLHSHPGDRWAGIMVWQNTGMFGRTLFVRLDSHEWHALVEIDPAGSIKVSRRERKNA